MGETFLFLVAFNAVSFAFNAALAVACWVAGHHWKLSAACAALSMVVTVSLVWVGP